jgi:hypothetical protein
VRQYTNVSITFFSLSLAYKMVKEIKNLEEFYAFINQDKLVAVHFCVMGQGYSQSIATILDSFAEATPQAEFAEVDTYSALVSIQFFFRRDYMYASV